MSYQLTIRDRSSITGRGATKGLGGGGGESSFTPTKIKGGGANRFKPYAEGGGRTKGFGVVLTRELEV